MVDTVSSAQRVQLVDPATNLPYAASGGSGGSGDASAANQTTQITAANLTNTDLGGVTETAPASDTASSGLNGRLQRIAQRLTSLIAQVPASLGAKVGASSFSVIRATDDTLPSGSNLIGKVGIDQTTPGTTNLVTSVGSRLIVPVKGTVSNAVATYTGAGISVGGLVTIATGLPAGTVLASAVLRLKVLYADQALNGGLTVIWFDANPTTSTITDGSALITTAADVPKLITFAVAAWGNGPTVTATNLITAAGPRIKVDGSGNIYVALITAATNQYTSANAISYEFDGSY